MRIYTRLSNRGKGLLYQKWVQLLLLASLIFSVFWCTEMPSHSLEPDSTNSVSADRHW